MIYYKEVVRAKNGEEVPLFANKKPMHSKYNPQREAELCGADIKSGFVVVLGIGGGFHIEALLGHLEAEHALVACEADEESLAFCLTLSRVKQLLEHKNVSFCTLSELEEKISAQYVPSFYGDFHFLPHRAWEAENGELAKRANAHITRALKAISADFSVQSHFGKIWQRNILLNMKFCGAFHNSAGYIKAKNHLTAAVIAAGPSLDRSILDLARERERYVIFATDTAYGALLAHGIEPDVVVSVDGQSVSCTHYFPCPTKSGTVFVFDLCASSRAVRLVQERQNAVYVVHSSHPLAVLAAQGTGVPHIQSGSGTVTIAACDLARVWGFTKIALFGADFCYNNGKAYTKGTYLDTAYYKDAFRLKNAETAFANLLFRTETKAISVSRPFSKGVKNAFSSQVLEGYEASLLDWARANDFTLKETVLVQKKEYNKEENDTNAGARFCAKDFFCALARFASEPHTEGGQKSAYKQDILPHDCAPFLPYIAWLRKNAQSLKKHSFFDLLKLANSNAKRYTILYEK